MHGLRNFSGLFSIIASLRIARMAVICHSIIRALVVGDEAVMKLCRWLGTAACVVSFLHFVVTILFHVIRR